ncbi:MAG: hypothetical protein HQL53_09990 [Magnetococcales bacterium]|nr:hypothetical protein [Magnetococcales bacterium]
MRKLLIALLATLILPGCFDASTDQEKPSFDANSITHEKPLTQERSWLEKLFFEDPSARSNNRHGHSH